MSREARSGESEGAVPAGGQKDLLTRRVQVGLDVLVFSAALVGAYLVRFDFAIPPGELNLLTWQLPTVVLLQLLCQWGWGIYRFVWRLVGLAEVKAFVGASLSSLCALLLIRLGFPFLAPEVRMYGSIALLDAGLAFAGALGIRVLMRVHSESQARGKRAAARAPHAAPVRVLLVGAGKAGVMAAREIRGGELPHLDVAGFVDDDPQKLGTVIHGIPVLGTTADVPSLVEEGEIAEVIITIARASRAQIRRIVELCERTRAKVRIIPGLYEILGGKVELSAVRNVDISDLLGREAVKLDEEGLHGLLSGKTVLVTGAGGSIGSELVRQLVAFSPREVVLVERSEFALYQVDEEIGRRFPARRVVPVLADVCDVTRMRSVFRRYRPHVVLHAAAYKHVPLVEWNPGEAARNNILGTLRTGELAGEHGAEAFILISTDKAVNPASVMGATKRVAELAVQMLDRRFPTVFVAVRFGNVLGSTGSVVPKFREQIARGGPVTVTHPEMKRYFMTIPEAAQLVLQAGALGEGGEIFILDMGEPVRIVDLARDMIQLSGLVPDEDVKIVFTGIRPGEKLFEELGTAADAVDRTKHGKIFVGRIPPQAPEKVMASLSRIAGLVDDEDGEALRAELERLVPEATLRDGAVVAQGSGVKGGPDAAAVPSVRGGRAE